MKNYGSLGGSDRAGLRCKAASRTINYHIDMPRLLVAASIIYLSEKLLSNAR